MTFKDCNPLIMLNIYSLELCIFFNLLNKYFKKNYKSMRQLFTVHSCPLSNIKV